MYARHRATAMGFVRVTRTCEKCGHQAALEVAAEGLGTAHSPCLLDPDASERAEESAASDLSRDAQISAGLVPCGACGARERSAVRGALVRSLKPLLVLFPLTFLMTAFVAALVVNDVFGNPPANRPLPAHLLLVPGAGLLLAFAVSALVARRGYLKFVQRAEGAACWAAEP